MASVVDNIVGYPPEIRSMVEGVETEVARAYASYHGRSSLTRCMLVSEREIDEIIPPYVRESNKKAARQIGDEEIDETLRLALERVKVPPEKAEAMKKDRILGSMKTQLKKRVGLNDEVRTRRDDFEELYKKLRKKNLQDLGPLVGDVYGTARSILEDKIRERSSDYAVFTAMGCYARKTVSLCPPRIEGCAKRLGISVKDLLQIVWTHEEAHSLLSANISPEMSEHLAQMLTATILGEEGRADLLEAMERLALHQPREYGLYCQEPNRSLISIKERKPPLASDKNPTKAILGTGSSESKVVNEPCPECGRVAALHETRETWPAGIGFSLGGDEKKRLCGDCTKRLIGKVRKHNELASRSFDLPYSNLYVDGKRTV